MKLTAIAVVILALGIVLGLALAGGASGRPASAIPQCPGPSAQCPTPTPSPPQQREDQIVIFTATGNARPLVQGATYDILTRAEPIMLALDPADYAPSALFRFEAIWSAVSPATTCIRIFDATAGTAVAGSEVCHTIPLNTGTEDVRVRSGPISPLAGEHEYTVQGKCDSVICDSPAEAHVFAARIIVEWTE